jgi:hypothetical protein
VQKTYPATGSVDLFGVHQIKGRYSSSGVAKMSIAQNISTLHKGLTPLLAVLISSGGAGTERGVTAVCVCTCCGDAPACDVPVAGLLK